jgi:hypothetical protein
VQTQDFSLTFVSSFPLYIFQFSLCSCIYFIAGLTCFTFVQRIFSIGTSSELRGRSRIMFLLHTNILAHLQIGYFLLDYSSSCFHAIQFPFASLIIQWVCIFLNVYHNVHRNIFLSNFVTNVFNFSKYISY